MSDEAVYHDAPKTQEYDQTTAPVKVEPTSETVDKEDRGLFDFLGKKKEEENKCEETAISSEFEQKVDVSEPEPKSEEQHETLFQKMHISHSGSSSSSDDEECEDGEKKKKKKKKPLTEQLKEKIEERKERKEEEEAVKKLEDDSCVPIEKYEEEVAVAPPPYNTDVGHHTPTDVVHHDPTSTPEAEEKKGIMERIKEKLPGGHKKPVEEQVAPPPPTPVAPAVVAHEEEPEKKGILEKIKEKIPGYHSKSEEEKEKEKVKECD
ncbi:dehydrin ERD14-like [Cynara cardunculus var. scolymus]|uniref:Dehydrin n=1 Tax=Cynara cardunculus var. scolymus TaxID=59895 RepID=A0A103Y9X4_CYNCS|nr:dehydrin ERD14-like [Cynara cardunculus var. scolymus]KVI05198.1 Dehydrin [Cynara cardunculus var. scolymus]